MRLGFYMINLVWCLDIVLAKEDAESLANDDVTVESLKRTVGDLARQVMLQQVYLEEKIRADGDSGIKQCRIFNEGSKTYHLPSTRSKIAIAGLHDHSKHIRTVGIGEFVAVLNGVEFRTRHNDFLLHMPSTKSRNFLETENIPFPDVPPEVTSKGTVDEQILEMREWIKAFHEQDYSVRDYRKYFPPILCYLEGTWIDKDYADIVEPFVSDRHFLDAKSFDELQDKIMYTSYGGKKSYFENFAWLPTTIMDVINGTTPKYAQWIYRILCHPLKNDLPTNRMQVVDDLSARMKYLQPLDEYEQSRESRFQLNSRDSSTWSDQLVTNWELIDDLMGEIPGFDNYGGNLTDDSFNENTYDLLPDDKKKRLNTAYYHRWMGEDKPGTWEKAVRKRGYADGNMFMAMTTQKPVVGKSLEYCEGEGQSEVCNSFSQRWSFAIPLEIQYLSPLFKWNPYDIIYWGDADKDDDARAVKRGDRSGGFTTKTALNGTNSKYFYQTPGTLFEGRNIGVYKGKGSVGVLDREGNVRTVTASGPRTLLPTIPGIGIVRLRYPIMPLHNDGNAVQKEVDALKDIVMEQARFLKMFREPPNSLKFMKHNSISKTGIILQMSPAKKGVFGPHLHRVILTPEDLEILYSGRPVNILSSEDFKHSHLLKLIYKPKQRNPFVIFRCDGKRKCWDGHSGVYQVGTFEVP